MDVSIGIAMDNVKNCEDCLLRSRRTQVVMPTACAPGGLLAIGEAPGADEDIAGEGFVGRAGKTLDKLLAAHGVARADYGRANICRCRPVDDAGKNRKPTTKEVDACLPKLAEFIGNCRPGVILCVGWTPGQMFVPGGTLAEAIAAGPIGFDPGGAPGMPGMPAALNHLAAPVRVVVMPHTSPLAFNRNAPDGRKWAHVAVEQIAVAVDLLL